MRKRELKLARSPRAANDPKIKINRIGLVSRDYRRRFPNGYRDFSHTLSEVLERLDDECCDVIIFSMYSIIARSDFDCGSVLTDLKHVRMVLLEEFRDGAKRKALRNIILWRTGDGWRSLSLQQAFSKVPDRKDDRVDAFVTRELPVARIFGPCCVLLCGELNGVRYAPKKKIVTDIFGLRAAIPTEVRIILNPTHDRMTRFEMPLKRAFLSKDRWFISVWNKGRRDRRGLIKDGARAAWDVFCHGKRRSQSVRRVGCIPGLEIGVLDV